MAQIRGNVHEVQFAKKNLHNDSKLKDLKVEMLDRNTRTGVHGELCDQSQLHTHGQCS